ncbi:terpenoid synthase [Penicillium taxi]|uniref:terpenoid synthase n=1 Tax=Penicillium taxi TaxID=168475 RepID=UPI002545A0B9|nr:terpenoid synthase [Penicillium taxi]KAJ5899144.1 terpenoid synthase [Penicillium taxi]
MKCAARLANILHTVFYSVKELQLTRKKRNPTYVALSGSKPESPQDDESPDSWYPRSHQVVMEPFYYLLSNPGKNTLSLLIDAFNEWLQVPEDKLKIIKSVVNVLHNASLLIDDIQDDSTLRRGFPVTDQVFGTAQTINSANYAYFLAFRELQKLESHEAGMILIHEMINLHLGHGMDLFWRETSICPSETDYLEMVNNKTGGLYRIMIRLMQLESTCPRDYVDLAEILGKLLQIRDDYKNLQSDFYSQKKGIYKDITEGKFSFLVIHHMHTDPDSEIVRRIMKQKTDNERIKDVVLSCLSSTGSFEYTERTIKDLARHAELLIMELDDERKKADAILDLLKMLQI